MPGPRNPAVTPYMIPFVRAAGTAKRVVMVCGAQMGKTDSILDLIGQRLDQRPGPLLYVGPSRDFVTQQFEPRIAELLDTPALRDKMASARRQKLTKKIVAGVPLRLAHAGSSTALKSDPASLALVDEYDEMLSNIKGQGETVGLTTDKNKKSLHCNDILQKGRSEVAFFVANRALATRTELIQQNQRRAEGSRDARATNLRQVKDRFQ